MELKTPLYQCHERLGGKIVPFAGYLLPVQYPTGVITEHMAVRQKAGLFDVSHMGEAVIKGPDALANLQLLMCNDMDGMYIGRVRYSPMCNANGGIVDDLMVYKMDEERYMLCINAANRAKDISWIHSHIMGEVEFKDVSDDFAQLALQGPLAKDIISKLTDASKLPEKYYSFIENGVVAGINCIISKTGYTGEDGYELYCAPSDAEALWNRLLEAGQPEGLIPCGLGARDTLRLEAAMPLYGHEMTDDISPVEAGLSVFCKLDKQDFIGKRAIVARGEPKQKRIGLKVTGRGIAREHQDVYCGDVKIGFTTSGTHCPYLGGAFAMAMLDEEYAQPGKAVEVDIRGKKVACETVALPFYKRAKK